MSLRTGDPNTASAASKTVLPSQSDTTVPTDPSGTTAPTLSSQTDLTPHRTWIEKHHRRAIESGLNPTHGTFQNLSLYKINPHPQIRPTALLPDEWTNTYHVDPMKTNLIPLKRDEIQAGIKRCVISEEYTTEQGCRDLLMRLKEFDRPSQYPYLERGERVEPNFDDFGQSNLFTGVKVQQSDVVSDSHEGSIGGEVEDDKFLMRVQIDPFFHVNKYPRYDSDIVYDRKHDKPFGNESYYGGLSQNYLKAMLRNYKDSNPFIKQPGDVLCGLARSLWDISHMISDLPAEEERAMLEEYTDEHGRYGKGTLFGDVDGVKSRTVIIDNPSNHIYPKVAISYTNLQSYLTRQRELENFIKLPFEDIDMRHDSEDTYQNPVNSKWCLSSTKERENHGVAESRDRQNRFENHTNMQNPADSRWNTPRPECMNTQWYDDDDPDRDQSDDQEKFTPIDRDRDRFYHLTYPEDEAGGEKGNTPEDNDADSNYRSDQDGAEGDWILESDFPKSDGELSHDTVLGPEARAQRERVDEMIKARREQRAAEIRETQVRMRE
ncbi:hypothetical protein I302_106902 [Kwoniella bestiolae CBS 10118]|uniref:Uncharacterized protein n=1 Tax=Kwoniella bestiolae CBS 10118 TaxID=1296100 RepID=A0A1B9G034_9TREE|nr:hypothetical protein I302_05832 [Kwoniella bestiolae CBS 10118]OCF24372.1 hypothetical protein I302_05832 [Kwoniella bestiolae CBS 10118]